VKRFFTAIMLVSLLTVTGCGGDKNKGINRDKDKPKPSASVPAAKKGASPESSPRQHTLSPGLVC
jgi:hypothetical protein